MTPVTEKYHEENGWMVQTVPEGLRHRLRGYTAYSSWPGWPRGEYGEEVDVRAMGPAPAKRIAQARIDEICEPGGRIVRLVYRPDGILFF